MCTLCGTGEIKPDVSTYEEPDYEGGYASVAECSHRCPDEDRMMTPIGAFNESQCYCKPEYMAVAIDNPSGEEMLVDFTCLTSAELIADYDDDSVSSANDTVQATDNSAGGGSSGDPPPGDPVEAFYANMGKKLAKKSVPCLTGTLELDLSEALSGNDLAELKAGMLLALSKTTGVSPSQISIDATSDTSRRIAQVAVRMVGEDHHTSDHSRRLATVAATQSLGYTLRFQQPSDADSTSAGWDTDALLVNAAAVVSTVAGMRETKPVGRSALELVCEAGKAFPP
jgi:hypothetical protein